MQTGRDRQRELTNADRQRQAETGRDRQRELTNRSRKIADNSSSRQSTHNKQTSEHGWPVASTVMVA